MNKMIDGYRYYVTEDGRVYSLASNKWVKICKHNGGKTSNKYRYVALYHNGKHKHALVHRLVAQAFIPNPDNLPEVNHKDLDKSNNHVSNLEWCTHAENVEHYHKKKRELDLAFARDIRAGVYRWR